MRNRLDLKETEIAHWDGANNLPGATSEKPGWNDGADMTMAKLIAWQYAVEVAGSEDILVARTDWAKFGVTGQGMLAAVRRCVPGFDQAYEVSKQSRAGATNRSKAAALYNRVFHMYREQETEAERRAAGHKTRKKVKRLSCEHPQRSKRLRPFVNQAIRLYHKKGN